MFVLRGIFFRVEVPFKFFHAHFTCRIFSTHPPITKDEKIEQVILIKIFSKTIEQTTIGAGITKTVNTCSARIYC